MGERWDRDRFMAERERTSRDQGRDQGRFEEDRFSMRGGRGGREHSVDERRFNRGFDDDDMVRDRRWYGDEPRPIPRRETMEPERRRPPVMERERERERDFAPRRPGFIRRQSSLDTFDRRPRIFQDREEYGPPARRDEFRREEFRAPPYTPIPLPKTRGLPPPRRFPDQGFYDDIKVAEPDYYGDDDFRSYPDRIREREYARTRRHRSRSRDSFSTRTRSHRSSSISSSTSSRSSSSSGGTTVRSEYPKKGKTRIPAKLVSKRALIDLGYPFFEEGNTIIVQKALGQDNIDELLKVSEDYKKVEKEIAASRAPVAALPAPPQKQEKPKQAPTVVVPVDDDAAVEIKPIPLPPKKESKPAPLPEEQLPPPRREEPKPAPPPVARAPEVRQPMPPPPAPVAPVQQMPPQQIPPQQMPPPMQQPAQPLPYVMNPYPPAPYEVVDETYIRDVSPDRSSSTSSWDSHTTHRRRRRKSAGTIILGSRSRSRSRSGHELRAEIRALERELAHRPKGSSGREIVQAERLPNGEVVIYEDRVEKVVEHHKPPRIEKDKKGRMSISVPKRR